MKKGKHGVNPPFFRYGHCSYSNLNGQNLNVASSGAHGRGIVWAKGQEDVEEAFQVGWLVDDWMMQCRVKE